MKPEYAKVYAFDPEMITNLPFVHYKTKKTYAFGIKMRTFSRTVWSKN